MEFLKICLYSNVSLCVQYVQFENYLIVIILDLKKFVAVTLNGILKMIIK